MQESIVFLVRVQCRRKESSRSLSHLLMSFLFAYAFVSAGFRLATWLEVYRYRRAVRCSHFWRSVSGRCRYVILKIDSHGHVTLGCFDLAPSHAEIQSRSVHKAARLIESCQSYDAQIISREWVRAGVPCTNDCLFLRQVAQGNLSRCTAIYTRLTKWWYTAVGLFNFSISK